MRIKTVRLKNGYKRFRDLTIDLGPEPARIVALVGPNGSGKSSVLDGITMLAGAYATIGAGSDRGYVYYSMDGNPGYNWQNIEIDFTEGTFASVAERRSQAGNRGTMVSFRSPYRYNSDLKVKQIQATNAIRQNDYGARDAASLDAKMEQSYRRLLAAVNHHMESHDVAPSVARASILGELNASIKNCLDLEITSVGNVEGGKGTLFFSKPDHPNAFEFNVLSSGEKEVIDLLLDLFLRKADFTETIFLIDEPELHINTSIQSKLLLEIDKLVGQNCQIWVTTHSIGFLRALQTQMKDQCQIIHFRGDLELAAKPYTLTPMKVSAAAWRELFAVALDDLATLLSPKTIVYCEGRAEPGKAGVERGMDAKVFNTVFAADHPETLFVSSGGNTELDQRSTIAVAILGKVFPTLDVLLLKDRDVGSGKPINAEARTMYLKTNPPNHRILKRWEIENYLFDKEVLRAFCEANGHAFDEASYDGFVTNIHDQNVKDETGRIKNFCSIQTSVSADAFKIALAEYLVPGMATYSELEGCIFARP